MATLGLMTIGCLFRVLADAADGSLYRVVVSGPDACLLSSTDSCSCDTTSPCVRPSPAGDQPNCMSITLRVEPSATHVTWDDFCARTEPYSVALDGYVAAGPRYDHAAPRANFNHHEEVDRLATRSTCAQVLMAIRQGLFRRFRTSSGPQLVAYVNDCDEDVCTAWYLLQQQHTAEHTMNPLLNRLVSMEDALDTTGGAYPFPVDLPILRKLAWVYDPYRCFRHRGGLQARSAREFEEIILQVADRIGQHVMGHGHTVDLDVEFDVIGGGPGWTMVNERGCHARLGMFARGIQTFVSVKERGDGRWDYVAGRPSPYTGPDMVALAERMNVIDSSPDDRWGGGDGFCCSPRGAGSTVSPDAFQRIVNEQLENELTARQGVSQVPLRV